MGVHLMRVSHSVHLISVHLISVCLIGVHLTGVHLAARSKQVCICIGWKQLSYSLSYLWITSDLRKQHHSRQP